MASDLPKITQLLKQTPSSFVGIVQEYQFLVRKPGFGLKPLHLLPAGDYSKQVTWLSSSSAPYSSTWKEISTSDHLQSSSNIA